MNENKVIHENLVVVSNFGKVTSINLRGTIQSRAFWRAAILYRLYWKISKS